MLANRVFRRFVSQDVEARCDIRFALASQYCITELGGNGSLADFVSALACVVAIDDGLGDADQVCTLFHAGVDLCVSQHFGSQVIDLGVFLREFSVLGSQRSNVSGFGSGESLAGIGKALLQGRDNDGALVGYFNRDAVDGNRLQGHGFFLLGVVVSDRGNAPSVADARFRSGPAALHNGNVISRDLGLFGLIWRPVRRDAVFPDQNTGVSNA